MTLARLDEVLARGRRRRPWCRRVQRHPARARRGAGRGRRADRPAGRAADQRERRALPRLRWRRSRWRRAAIAERATVPCVLHLDHAVSEPLVDEAVALGFTSVMFDGSRLGDEANRTATRAVVQRCHAAGVSVEAELGEIGGKDGVHAPGVRTDPAAAAQFVADCGVDALAVAVGSSHAMTSRTAELDLELIAAIHERVPVPLVLHGASGVPDADLVAAVRGRDDEGEHRHAPQQRVHHGTAPAPRRGPGRGRHPASTWAPPATPWRPRRPGCCRCSPCADRARRAW